MAGPLKSIIVPRSTKGKPRLVEEQTNGPLYPNGRCKEVSQVLVFGLQSRFKGFTAHTMGQPHLGAEHFLRNTPLFSG